MQSASATALRYAALSDVLGRQMQIARAAVRGGQ
jgi:flagellar basal-body rod protein FlgB